MFYTKGRATFSLCVKEKVGKKKSDLRQMGVFSDGWSIFVASRKCYSTVDKPFLLAIFTR